MTTSDQLKLIETYSQQAKNAKPMGEYTRSEILKLEADWRIKLKQSGFSDYELWGTPAKYTRKQSFFKRKIKFIKGHIRWHRYGDRAGLVYKLNQTAQYYRIIGLYAHHCPDMPEKYREVLKEYAETGWREEAIRSKAPQLKSTTVHKYLVTNFPKMLTFVNQLDTQEEEDEQRAYNNRQN